jgi:hypothetical protein
MAVTLKTDSIEGLGGSTSLKDSSGNAISFGGGGANVTVSRSSATVTISGSGATFSSGAVTGRALTIDESDTGWSFFAISGTLYIVQSN